MKSNAIKMYDKFSCLRIEMTINDPREFKVYKEVTHKDGSTSRRWVPMGKSIANLYRYAEVSKAANKRFLDSLQNIILAKSLEKEVSQVCGKKTVKGRTFTGYNVWSPDKPDSPANRGKTSRTFAKLRAHGLIRKIPHSRRYLVSDKGRRVMGALIEARRKTYPELAAV